MSETEMLQTTRHRIGRVYPLERHARGDELAPDQRLAIDEPTPINPLTGKRRRRRSQLPIQVAHLKITDLRLQRLGDIAFKDARAEGFQTSDEFKIAWVQQRDRRWCAVTDDTGDPAEAMLERFDDRHANTLVWALSLTVVEQPRLLRATPGYDDYTDTPARAARAEPEAITDDQLQRLTQFAAAKDDARRRKPLASHAHNMARELDELRNRMPAEGLVDRDLKRAIRHAELVVDKLRVKLDAA